MPLHFARARNRERNETMKKKVGTRILSLLMTLVMALSLVACGKEKDPTADWGPEPEGTIEVEIWTLFGETLRNQYQKVIDDFNASQTKYHVTCETQGSAAEPNGSGHI